MIVPRTLSCDLGNSSVASFSCKEYFYLVVSGTFLELNHWAWIWVQYYQGSPRCSLLHVSCFIDGCLCGLCGVCLWPFRCGSFLWGYWRVFASFQRICQAPWVIIRVVVLQNWAADSSTSEIRKAASYWLRVRRFFCSCLCYQSGSLKNSCLSQTY